MIRIFTGYDPRQAIGWHAFAQSVIDHTRDPVSIIPLTMNSQKDGTNAFTYSRFLVPELCDFSGFAIFADGVDMLAVGDFAELWTMRDSGKAVQVVKHQYATKHARKYVGTEMEAPNEDYRRKNWSSLILWNCAHPAHFYAREMLRGSDGKYLHRFSWLKEDDIGELPKEWNWLADEYGENQDAKLLHWTAGQPGFYHYKDAPHAAEWRASVRNVMGGMFYDPRA